MYVGRQKKNESDIFLTRLCRTIPGSAEQYGGHHAHRVSCSFLNSTFFLCSALEDIPCRYASSIDWLLRRVADAVLAICFHRFFAPVPKKGFRL